eukprot:11079994-Alexandrium_andersonii.AAC.1
MISRCRAIVRWGTPSFIALLNSCLQDAAGELWGCGPPPSWTRLWPQPRPRADRSSPVKGLQ